MSPFVPHGLAEIMEFFGNPKFSGSGVSPVWESANMVLVNDLPLVSRLYVHKKIEGPLRAALTDCAELGLDYHLHTLGCFAPRCQRGSNHVSIHTFGAAVDINADKNPLITSCPTDDPRRKAPGAYDIPQGWIAAFKKHGFFWGGDFQKRFDPQHFQYATGY